MNNIDKDIEKVKDFLNGKKMQCGEKGYKNNNNFMAIENVLKALEGKDCVIETQAHNEDVYEELVEKLEKELEIYKKIAEYLAVYGRETCPDCNSCENKVVLGYENGSCKKFNNVTECIIDRARKEVEKDE